MKQKTLYILTSLLLVACITTSCLKDNDEDYDYSANASITAFSINDIETKYSAIMNGKDTILIDTVIGSNYPFSIDQNNGRIFNADSLPYGTDVSKVNINISADTYGIFICAEQDSLWESTDSLNFENPIQFKVVSGLGTYGRIYTAQINVHQQDPDSLVWNKIESNLHQNIQAQKSIYANNKLYLFTEQEGQTSVTTSEDGITWTELQTLDIPTKTDYTSAIAWNEKIYILAENELYSSTNGLNWEKVATEQKISKLMACIDFGSSKKLIGADMNNAYIESFDGIEWGTYDALPENFPTEFYSFAAYPLETNPNMARIALMGQINYTELDNTVWTQLDNEHSWYNLYNEGNDYACPNFRKPTLIYYNDQLYAFGGPGQTNEAFDYIYASKDHGINWEKQTQKTMFPAEFEETYKKTSGSYSCVVDANHFIWIIWGNGEVWRGRINKLGFNN